MCEKYEMLRLFTLTLLLVCAVPSEAADVAPEVASLGGAWTAVEAERDGAPAQEIVGHRLELAGNRFRLSVGSRLLCAGTYAIEPTAQGHRLVSIFDTTRVRRGARSGKEFTGSRAAGSRSATTRRTPIGRGR